MLLPILLTIGAQVAWGQYRFDRFTTNNGLPQNTVAAIAQTPDGFLWFATYDGLVRFDGVRFTIFDKGTMPSLKSNWFQTMCVDGRGRLWAGTVDGGLVQWQAGQFRTLGLDSGLPEKNVHRVLATESGEPLFLLVRDHWLRWNQGDDRAEPAARESFKRLVDATGAEWRLEDNAVVRTKENASTAFPIPLTLDEFALRHFVDKSGVFWIATNSGSLIRLGKNGVEQPSRLTSSPNRDSLRIDCEDREGGIWIHDNDGLFRFDAGKLNPVLDADGSKIGRVRCVFCDREGTVWVGTNDRGLFRLTRKFLETHTTRDGLLRDIVYPIFEDRAGTVWIGSERGIVRHSNGRFVGNSLIQGDPSQPNKVELASPTDGRRNTSVRAFCQDRSGRLWIGHDRGLFAFENGEITDQSALVAHAVTDVVYADRQDNLWVGTGNGVFRIDARERTRYSTEQGLPDSRVTAILQDRRDAIWIGTRAGLVRLEKGRFDVAAGCERLTGHRIRCLFEDKAGILWVGTFDLGLWRIEDGKATQFSTQNGLYNNGVFAILDDGDGNFWMSCNRGIYRVGRSQLEAVAAGKSAVVSCVAYGSQDGMLSAECNGERQPAGVRTRDGRLWFPTQRGVVVVDPKLVPHNTQPPVVTIESALVDRKPSPDLNRVTLQPGQSDLDLNYTAPSSFKAEHVQFRYMMHGLDKHWVEAGGRRSVNYSHLPVGNYTFQVIAANSDGVWNETGVRLDVEVQPFFYQTRWFLVASILSGIAIAVGIGALRVRVLKANTRHLEALVAAKTVDLVEHAQQLEAANRKLEALATLDGLTNIANHRRFKEFLAQEWQRSQRRQTPIALLLLDIDFFKQFNDTYGHQQGDACLKRVAGTLAATVGRSTDLCARYGGEEFAIVLTDTNLEGAGRVAESVRSAVEGLAIPHSGSKAAEHVTLSIGAAITTAKRNAIADDLIAAADKLLYEAKHAGRNRCVIADV